MRKVYCDYCGRQAEYVDSKVVYAPPQAGRSGPPAGGYPSSNYGGGDFTELGDDDDGELPF